ncbi:MAG: hypothetical protein NC218_03290 [Acetobacter sp.]|nr:hypothetical protein [Acetobacter sp.]
MDNKDLENINFWLDRMGDINPEEQSAVLYVKQARKYLKANIVYMLYKVEGQEDDNAQAIRESADALEQLAQMDDDTPIKLGYNPMGAYTITLLKEA